MQPEPYRAVLSGSREGSGRGARRRRGGDGGWSMRGLATASSLLLLASVCGVLFFRSGGTMEQGLASNYVELQSNLPADVKSCIRACVHVNMMVSASSPSGSPHASCEIPSHIFAWPLTHANRQTCERVRQCLCFILVVATALPRLLHSPDATSSLRLQPVEGAADEGMCITGDCDRVFVFVFVCICVCALG
jgi:hypothetical protein